MAFEWAFSQNEKGVRNHRRDTRASSIFSGEQCIHFPMLAWYGNEFHPKKRCQKAEPGSWGGRFFPAESATKKDAAERSTARNDCVTREPRRLCKTELGNGPGLLGLLCSLLIGLLGFLCHAHLLLSFSCLLSGHAKRMNRNAARCHSYTGDRHKCQENFAFRPKNPRRSLKKSAGSIWAIR